MNKFLNEYIIYLKWDKLEKRKLKRIKDWSESKKNNYYTKFIDYTSYHSKTNEKKILNTYNNSFKKFCHKLYKYDLSNKDASVPSLTDFLYIFLKKYAKNLFNGIGVNEYLYYDTILYFNPIDLFYKIEYNHKQKSKKKESELKKTHITNNIENYISSEYSQTEEKEIIIH